MEETVNVTFKSGTTISLKGEDIFQELSKPTMVVPKNARERIFHITTIDLPDARIDVREVVAIVRLK